MAGAKRLAQLAKKWQRVEALGRKRLRVSAKEDEDCCTTAPAKGHCVMYTADGRRFEVPLVYLSTTVFGELLRMAKEEFGFASDGKIILPSDAPVMEYVMSLLRRNASADVENALLSSMFAWLSSKSEEKIERSCITSHSPVAGKGHCIVYTADGMRFEVPLVFLGATVFSAVIWPLG